MAIVISSTAAAQPKFQATDIGAFADDGSGLFLPSKAFDINNNGQVVGFGRRAFVGQVPIYDWDGPSGPFFLREREIIGYETGTVYRENAFLYDSKTNEFVWIGDPDENSRAYGINDRGDVVGSVGFTTNTQRAFRAFRGHVEDLGDLNTPVTSSVAYDINESGTIVGNSFDSNSGNAWFSASFNQGQLNNLGTLLGKASHARAINDAGQIVGDSFLNANGTGNIHATRLTGDTVKDLGTLGGNNSNAWDINGTGMVVGQSEFQLTSPSSLSHAALFLENGVVDLGTLNPGEFSFAYGINDQGQIVGRSGKAAFIYTENQMFDLNDLLINDIDGWTLFRADSINELGQIVGYARRDGSLNTEDTRAFLLTPTTPPGIQLPPIPPARDASDYVFSMTTLVAIPEPSTLAVFAAGTLLLLRKKR